MVAVASGGVRDGKRVEWRDGREGGRDEEREGLRQGGREGGREV